MSPIPHRSHPRVVCLAAPIVILLCSFAFFTLGMIAPAPPAPASGYDPMAVAREFAPKTVDLVVKDAARKRDIPVRIYLPDSLHGRQSGEVEQDQRPPARALQGDRAGERNPNHHRAIVALSTAFWDTYLRNDPAARAWLNGNGPASVLEKADRWQKK